MNKTHNNLKNETKNKILDNEKTSVIQLIKECNQIKDDMKDFKNNFHAIGKE